MIEKLREDIFETMLNAAVIENSLEELAGYPDEREIRKTKISERCDRRVRRLMMGFYYREKASSAWRIARKAVAVAAIAITLAFGALYLHSEEIQAAVHNALFKIFDGFVELNYNYDTRANEGARLSDPGYLPEGYEKDSEEESRHGSMVMKRYKNQDGEEIRICIVYAQSVSGTFDSEGYDISECEINDYKAHLLLTKPTSADRRNKLIWNMEGIMINIEGQVGKEDLIKIGESLK